MSFGHIRPLTRGALLALTVLLSAQGCIFTEEELPPSQPNNQSSCAGDNQCRDPQTNVCQDTPAGFCRGDEGSCKALGTNEDCRFCGDRCGLSQECVSINGQSQCLDVEVDPDECTLDVNDPISSDSTCEEGLVCQRGPNGDVCVPPCTDDMACGPSQRCDVLPSQPPQAPMRCVARCQSDNDCSGEERCDAGVCVLQDPCELCREPQVCLKLESALGVSCLDSCTDAGDCRNGDECREEQGVKVCLFPEIKQCVADQCTVKAPNTEPLPWDNGRERGKAECQEIFCLTSCEAGFERFGGSPMTGAGYDCWSSRNMISAGPKHTCVSLWDDGGRGAGDPIHHAYCWGEDRVPQAANQDMTTHRVEQMDLVEVAAGTRHTCALDKSNILRCFGDNSVRQLESNTVPPNGIVTPRINGEPVQGAEIAAGDDFSCLLTPTGRVVCWGLNDNGQLGRVQGQSNREVVSVSEPLRFIESVHASAQYACAVNVLGDLYCWGQYPGKPQASMLGAQRVMTPSPVRQLALGAQHICYVDANAEVLCMGANDKKQLGVNMPPGRDTFAKVNLGAAGKVVSLSAGAAHTCAVVVKTAPTESDIRLVCWGDNEKRQSTPSSAQLTAPPTEVNIFEDSCKESRSILRVLTGLGEQHSCALIIDQCNQGIIPVERQIVQCWGDNNSGQSVPTGGRVIEKPTTVKALCSDSATGVADCFAINF